MFEFFLAFIPKFLPIILLIVLDCADHQSDTVSNIADSSVASAYISPFSALDELNGVDPFRGGDMPLFVNKFNSLSADVELSPVVKELAHKLAGVQKLGNVTDEEASRYNAHVDTFLGRTFPKKQDVVSGEFVTNPDIDRAYLDAVHTGFKALPLEYVKVFTEAAVGLSATDISNPEAVLANKEMRSFVEHFVERANAVLPDHVAYSANVSLNADPFNERTVFAVKLYDLAIAAAAAEHRQIPVFVSDVVSPTALDRSHASSSQLIAAQVDAELSNLTSSVRQSLKSPVGSLADASSTATSFFVDRGVAPYQFASFSATLDVVIKDVVSEEYVLSEAYDRFNMGLSESEKILISPGIDAAASALSVVSEDTCASELN